MKKFLVMALLAPMLAAAAVTTVVTSGKYDLYRGTKKLQSGIVDMPACVAAIEKLDTAATYTCKVGNKVVATKVVAPPPSTPLALEGGMFTLDVRSTVMYGKDPNWATQVFTPGSYGCNNAQFGDPFEGQVKLCKLGPPPAPLPPDPIPPPTDHHAGIAVAPEPTWPVPQPGISTELLTPPGVIPVSRTGEYDGGEFRLVCNFAKMAFDDPIVYPGQPGVAHHHTFYGNTGVTAGTTVDNIRATGNATCRGGTINKSLYWHPSMIDTRTGIPLVPRLLLYYKSDTWAYMNPQPQIQPLPHGLRMITGDAKNTIPENTKGEFTCLMPTEGFSRPGTPSKSPPTTCQPGDEVWWTIPFNQCWDGKNLDSPDHKSHMANTEFNDSSTWLPGKQYRCPATHPVVIPKISMIVMFKLPAVPTDTQFWRLSSDTYDPALPGGYSAHADWMYGWDPVISDLWGVECMQKKRDCGTANLGDGRVTIEYQGN